MNEKIPRTPFSTPLSGSARETERRLRNIFSGPKKRPPLPLLILVFSICIFCGNLVSCNLREDTSPDTSQADGSQSDGPSTPDADASLQEMVLRDLQARYEDTVYLAEDAPEVPQLEDRRLDSVTLLGTTELEQDEQEPERLGLYQVQCSVYSQRAGQLEWLSPDPTYLVFLMNADGTPAEPLMQVDNYSEDVPVGDAIRLSAWGLSDLEVCLFRDGYSIPIGPGGGVHPRFLYMFSDMEPITEVVEEGAVSYQPGDFWETWTVGGGWEQGGVSALRYYDPERYNYFASRLETGRTDMYTPRGIRVGSTREEVLAAYPGLLSDEKNWQFAYPDDYLWYCSNENGIGPHLYFFFKDDVVYMIQMVDLFD